MILFFIVVGKNCTCFSHLFVLVGCANPWGVVVVDEVRWRLDVLVTRIMRRKSLSWLVGRNRGVGLLSGAITFLVVGVMEEGAHFTSFKMLRIYLLFECMGTVSAVGV